MIEPIMTPPKSLDKEARAHWRRHYTGCVDNGSLTPETVDSFALVCRLWSLIEQTDVNADSKAAMKFASLVKHYAALAKPFGLLGGKAPPGKPPASLQDILAGMKRTTWEDMDGDGPEGHQPPAVSDR